jgi:glutathione peroxidase
MTRIDYTTPLKTISGRETALSEFADKTLLIVNTASKCGFTPQFIGLEALWRRHVDRGLVVLGFPCNQFRSQDPGDEAEIAAFCELNYGVTFPMFSKVEVNGQNTHPLFRQLKEAAPGLLGSRAIKWNFTKFVVRADGEILKRYAPSDSPDAIEDELRSLLGEAR